MPLQHRLCFGLGHQSQQLLPGKGGRRQPGQGDSNLSSAVAPWPNPDPLSPRYTIRNCIRVVCCCRKIKPVCSASSTVALRCAKHLNSTEGLISNKLLCHVNSLMADKRLSPCCTVADSRGDSITVSLPTLSFGTCGHSAAGTLHFRAHEQGLTSTRAPCFGCKSPPQGTCGPRGRWR